MKKLLLPIFTILICLNSNYAQVAALKATGFAAGAEATIVLADAGIEFYFKKHWGAQLSYSFLEYSTESRYRNKKVITPQLRYYFKENGWRKSLYTGILAQIHTQNMSDELPGSYPFPWEDINFKKVGFGILGGSQLIIIKRFGIDVNAGLIVQGGNEKRTLYEYSPSKTTITEKNVVNARPFFTLNFYLMLGKMK